MKLLPKLILFLVLMLSSCQAVTPTPDETGPQLTPTPTKLPPAPDNPTSTPTDTPPKPRPTINPDSVLALQVGNDLPITRFWPEYGFKESENNRIGDSYPLDPREPPCEFDYIKIGSLLKKVGYKWIRTSIDPMELDLENPDFDYSKMEINPCHTEEITYLSENDITILYTIVYWDEVLHANRYPNYQNEAEVQQYLDYTRMIVKEFRGKVTYYEILNEGYFYVPVDVYIELIRRVIPVIQEEDPGAKIVVLGTNYLMNPNMQWYLNQIIQSDIISQVDGIAMHPMYGTSPQYDDVRQYYQDYPEIIRGIQEMARANGFEGEFFAEEMCWRTQINPNPYEPWEYSATQAAKYYARGVVINLGLDVWAGVGGENYDKIDKVVTMMQSLSNLMIGAQPDDLVVEIESEAGDIVYYSFLYPNGDQLVAIWTDGIASDEDVGVAATLIIEDLNAESATGFDIFHTYQQDLVIEADENGLVIRDLVVRDYPTLIKLTNSE